ncbi:nucleotidyltransferase domain-containing protein [Halosimplex salinum]|uniref:nucleotidyltransferase domain-containing protein n=1 Tax=Halosimplex salinum TaxID=1710538 RepID=UPI001F209D09|nr:nucleotidyltransferase domain-containing protein [Halosimplex salinum]
MAVADRRCVRSQFPLQRRPLSDAPGWPPSVCSDSDVEFVVAFGSQITGGTTRGSDLDLAVKFADQRDDLRRQQRAVIDRIAEDGLRG